jgi:hypothetical protein
MMLNLHTNALALVGFNGFGARCQREPRQRYKSLLLLFFRKEDLAIMQPSTPMITFRYKYRYNPRKKLLFLKLLMASGAHAQISALIAARGGLFLDDCS